MLLNFVIRFLYMRILKIIFGKYFSALFSLFFNFLCEASRRWFCMSKRWGRFVRMFLIQVLTCAWVRYLTWHYVRTVNPLGLNRIPPALHDISLPHVWFFVSLCFFFFKCFSHVSLSSCDFSPPQVWFFSFLLISFKCLCLK